MNCQMTQLTVTYRDGRTSNLENVYIRGSKVRFMNLPDMLKNAPMFKKQGAKAGTACRGKSAILRAQGGGGGAGNHQQGKGNWQGQGPSSGRGRGGL
ncbi:AAEL012919-PA [Aedes aegypti]|uniref:AAEL012919-PA n=1 Tax=Aedes aegypti TaxID=7159 RepID=Q16KQ1_AEDAE|nr:AAEL012919-PA [Aedes aegypti]